jgi:hypothetical protein
VCVCVCRSFYNLIKTRVRGCVSHTTAHNVDTGGEPNRECFNESILDEGFLGQTIYHFFFLSKYFSIQDPFGRYT